jgi:uncharacterized protein (TIGR00251 family)
VIAEAWYYWQGASLVLNIRVQPRSSQNAVTAVIDGRLKVRLTAPPVDGEANRALLKFFAKACAVPRSRVTLLAGETGRDKRVRVDNPKRLPGGVDLPGR